MKKFSILLMPIILIFLSLSSTSGQKLNSKANHYKFVKRIDTTVIFDTETNIESIRIMESWGLKSISPDCFPMISLFGNRQGKLTKEQIQQTMQLDLKNNANCKDVWEIESYNVIMSGTNQENVVLQNAYGFCNDHVIQLLQKVKSGNQLSFENIFLINQNGDMAAGDDMVFTIK